MENIKEVNSGITEDDIKAFEEEEEKKYEEVEQKSSEENADEIKEEPAVATPQEILGDGLKNVDGETPKERALRAELTRIRRKKRESEQENLIKPTPIVEDGSADEELKAQGYDEEQISGLDKTFVIMAKKHGYVKKSDTLKENADETLNNFLIEHPEYSSENDKDDIYWGKFKTLSSDYNLNGKTPKQLQSIFNKIDRDVKEELGEKTIDKEKIEAQKRKIGDISKGTLASTPPKSTEPKKAMSAGNKTFVSSSHPGLVFKGFDEDEVEDFI